MKKDKIVESELPDDYKPLPGTFVKVEDVNGGEIVAVAALVLTILFVIVAISRGL